MDAPDTKQEVIKVKNNMGSAWCAITSCCSHEASTQQLNLVKKACQKRSLRVVALYLEVDPDGALQMVIESVVGESQHDADVHTCKHVRARVRDRRENSRHHKDQKKQT